MKKKTIFGLAFSIIGLATIIYAPTAANATEETEGRYVLAVWRNEAGAPKFPQYLITSYVTDSTNVDVLQSFVDQNCGSFLQSDLYANDERTAKLIAGGILNGGMESWPLDEQGNQIQRYKTFTTEPCVTPTPEPTTPPVIVTPEPTPPVTTPVIETPETTEEPSSPSTPPTQSTPTNPGSQNPSSGTTPTPSTPPTSALVTLTPEFPVVTPQPTASSDSGSTDSGTNTLAFTGDERTGVLFGAGLLILVIGAILVVTGYFKRKEN